VAVPFETADLGRVLATAETIKGMRRQSVTDQLRDQYLGVQMRNAEQAGVIAGQQEQRAQAEEQQKRQIQAAKQNYLLAENIERLPPEQRIAFIQQFAPEFIENYERKHGPGSFTQQSPEQIGQQASLMKQHLASFAGISLNGTPEQRFAAEQAQKMDATNFDQQKQLAGIQHEHRLKEIEATGIANAERAAASSERKTFRDIQSLRKEFEGMDAVKNYRTVQPIIESAKKAPDTGYGDMDLIYAVGKILDPGSVVREGELALTIAAGSPLQRILGTTRFSLERGGRLTPAARQQIVGMLEGRVGALESAYNQERERFSRYAQENGWDATQVVGAGKAQQGRVINHPSGAIIEIIEE
jgi:hypothetical protein